MKKICLFSFVFLVANLEAQNFKILNSKTQEPIDNVMGILYHSGQSQQIMKSDYNGDIHFNYKDKWDSVIFFRLGYKNIKVDKLNYLKIIFMTANANVIDEVIVTGLIAPGNRYQSPFKLKYYTAEEIKNKNAVTLADFLLTENNFSVTQDPLLGTKVSINGMSGADLKLMIDGIPVAGRVNGNIDYSQILLSNIERMEVVDGPLSTIYGTNATGGVINLITKTGTQSESSLTGNIYGESVGVLNANVYYNAARNGHRVSIGVHRNLFTGWDPNADSLEAAVKPIWRKKSWNPKEQTMINTSYYAPISNKHNIHFKLNGFWETIINKLNPASPYQINVVDEYYNTKRFNIGGNSNSILSRALDWQNYFNFNYFGRRTEYYTQNLQTGTQQPLSSVNEEILNYFGRSQIKHEFFNEKIKLLYGGDFNMDVGNSEKLDSNARPVRDLSFFVMGNYKPTSKLLIQPGLRYSFNNVATVPMSATFNVRYDISSHISSRFSYARGYRIPEIKELYFRFIDVNHNIQGNPYLQTETNDNFQFGIDVKPPKSQEKSHLVSYSTSLNTTYFIKDNAIDIVNVNPANNEFQYFNLGKYRGLIFNLDNRLKYKEYLLSLGMSLNGYSRYFNGTVNQIEDYMFNWTTNLNFTYYFKKQDIKLTTINKFYSVNNFIVYNLPANKVEASQFPAYMYSDINASKYLWKKRINLTIGVKNIFNIKNLQVIGYSGNVHNFSSNNEVNQLWGRTLFTSITLNLEDI